MVRKRGTKIEASANTHDTGLVKSVSNSPSINADHDKLRESEEKFKSIFDRAAIGIAIADPGGYIVDCNSAYQELLGYSKNELREKRFIEFTHPEDVGRNLELQRQLADGLLEKYQIEKRYIRKDGRFIWVLLTASAIRDQDGRLKNNLAVAEDITERKRAEEALKDSKANLDRAQRITALGNWEWDLKTDRLSGSREYYRIFGLTQQALSPFEFFARRLHPDDKKWVDAAINDIRYENLPGSYEFRILTEEGEVRYIHSEVEAVRDEKGRPAKIFGTMQDITERKRAEERARMANAYNRRLIEASLDPLVTIAPDGKITDVNMATEMMTGISRDKLIGTDFLNYFTDPDMARKGYEKVFEEGSVKDYPLELRHKDGRITPVLYNATVYRDESGEIIGVFAAARDITERKRAEEALRDSEERFRTLADSSRAGILLIEGEKVAYVNQALADIGGYTVEECLKLNFWDIIHPDFRDQILERIQKSLHNKKVTQKYDEIKIIRKDGHKRWISLSSGFLFYDKKPAIIVTIMDITPRKRAEEALRRSEEGLKKSQEISHVGSWELNLINNKLSWSDEVYRIFGLQPREFGATYEAFLEAIHPDDRAAVDAAYSGSIRAGRDSYEIEHRVVRKSDGEVRVVHEKCEHFRDGSGRIVRSVGMVQDITERKRAEKDLRLTQFSIDRSADIALWVAPDGRFIYANEAACKAFGYTREEFLSLRAFDTNPYFNEMNWGEHWKEVKERGSYTFEARLRKKDGTFFPGEITVNYLDYEGKEYNCSYIRDITDRKRAEEAVKDARAQAELYLDLMGHDINNLHQIALGYLELARAAHPHAGESEFLDKPVEVLQRSARLIQNVRKLQKLKDGVFRTQDVDVSSVLGDVRREFGSVPKKMVSLNLNGCEHCLVRANELLYDVFSNLVSNAIKHSGETAEIVIDLDIVKHNGRRYCRVMVEDNGPGIPDDFKPKIFNRELTGTNKARGMGLGLYLVKSLVASYSGRIWVEDRIKSDHTKGTRFVVMLPAAEK